MNNRKPEECHHPAKALAYLESSVTADVTNPDILSIKTFYFLCQDCGQIVQKLSRTSRGYLSSGDIPKKMISHLEKAHFNQAVDEAVSKKLSEGHT